MEVYFHKTFEKQLKKLTSKQKDSFKKKLKIFVNDAFDRVLNNHSLKGKNKHYRSINIEGDLRALYTTKENTVYFLEIGTHSELYG